MCKKNRKDKAFPRILAPFLILKVEKMYFSWIASFIISFMSIIVDLVNCSVENSFMQGAFYSTCIALLAPFLVEFFVEYTSSNRSERAEKYIADKGYRGARVRVHGDLARIEVEPCDIEKFVLENFVQNLASVHFLELIHMCRQPMRRYFRVELLISLTLVLPVCLMQLSVLILRSRLSAR